MKSVKKGLVFALVGLVAGSSIVNGAETVAMIGAAGQKVANASGKTLEFAAKTIEAGVIMNVKLPILQQQYKDLINPNMNLIQRKQIGLQMIDQIQDSLKLVGTALNTGGELVEIFQAEYAEKVYQSVNLYMGYLSLLKQIGQVLEHLVEQDKQAQSVAPDVMASESVEIAQEPRAL